MHKQSKIGDFLDSLWQRGGRDGRSGQDSALILMAAEDALDQYFMRNPRDFIEWTIIRASGRINWPKY